MDGRGDALNDPYDISHLPIVPKGNFYELSNDQIYYRMATVL